MANALLVAAYKPPFLSSNACLSRLKKHFGMSKAGYLGTLDPFAKGVLVVGFGSYTRLFPHLQKVPKTYRATLWLGAKSASLDIEHIESIEIIPEYNQSDIEKILFSLKGTFDYTPPAFSAKHINGQRAYKLAREGKVFTLPQIQMSIYNITLLSYHHPFVHFEVSVSEGAYVRSIGDIIAKKLGVNGVLSSLERISEGQMSVSATEQIRILNPLDYLPYPQLENMHRFSKQMYDGKKITLKNAQKGKYIVCFEDFFSIIEIFSNGGIQYILNRIEYVDTFKKTR